MNFESSSDENNDKKNERISPIVPYINDLRFPDTCTSETDFTSNTKEQVKHLLQI